ncbi:hypothetical protein P4S63_26005 [Pseudoalteromonas sp. B193]
MKTNNKVKLIAISLSLIFGSAGINAQPMPHIAQPGENWVLQTERSDEFDIKDAEKWNFQTENYGVWSWTDENASVSEGILKLTTKRETHLRTFWDGCNKTKVPNYRLFYTSGVAKSRATGSYGYYEARIKVRINFRECHLHFGCTAK